LPAWEFLHVDDDRNEGRSMACYREGRTRQVRPSDPALGWKLKRTRVSAVKVARRKSRNKRDLEGERLFS
jgi:hypothetical protein